MRMPLIILELSCMPHDFKPKYGCCRGKDSIGYFFILRFFCLRLWFTISRGEK